MSKHEVLHVWKKGLPLLAAALLVTMLSLNSCDDASNGITAPTDKNESTVNTKSTNISANLKLEIKYDQKTYSYATHWPASVVAGGGSNVSSKVAGDHSNMLLKNYEYRTYTIQYDKEGRYEERGSWPEGDASRSIPKELYDRVKNQMPAKAADYDPIVRWQIQNGQLSYFSRSGREVLSSSIATPPNSSEVASKIDSVVQANRMAVSERVSRNMAALKKSGLSFEKRGDRYALLSEKPGPKDAEDIAGYNQVVDLATGKVVRSAVKLNNGHYASLKFMEYKLVNHYPVMMVEQTYSYGKLSDGQWGVKRITITNRENLQVGYNDNTTKKI